MADELEELLAHRAVVLVRLPRAAEVGVHRIEERAERRRRALLQRVRPALCRSTAAGVGSSAAALGAELVPYSRQSSRSRASAPGRAAADAGNSSGSRAGTGFAAGGFAGEVYVSKSSS